MFENISEKIKNLAIITLILGVASAVIIFIALIILDADIASVIAFPVATGISVFISSLFIYGFGELIENTNNINKNINLILNEVKNNTTQSNKEEKTFMPTVNNKNTVVHTYNSPNDSAWVCEICGNKNPKQTSICLDCGRHK